MADRRSVGYAAPHQEESMRARAALGCGLFLILAIAAPLPAHAGCPEILAFLAHRAVSPVCLESADLTTNNATLPPTGPTTPADNSLPPWPLFAYTPRTDRAVISPDPPDRTPITRAVPGIQVQGYFAGDPPGQARFFLRLPNAWNGGLVVAGASGLRSEHNGDFAWSDFVVQQGYAYVSQNKGSLNFFFSTPADPLACRLSPNFPFNQFWVHFYSNDPGTPFTRWAPFMVHAARLARDAVKAHYGKHPARTYAVGTSNGGYQVRKAIEEAPDLFDGGVDWEGTMMENVLVHLPPALQHFPSYKASGYDPASAAAQAIRNAGYPPDIFGVAGQSFWELHLNSFWEVTACNFQRRFDPTYATYVAGLERYDLEARAAVTDVEARLAEVATTGKIKKPLVTVAGTMDALLPPDLHARAYEASVHASRKGDNAHRSAQYRYYEIQNGNHVDRWRNRTDPVVNLAETFPQLQFIQPHAQHAFELLVGHVENGTPLPPSQCVPRGGSIVAIPSQPGHCAALFVP
jgi:hypothetical protein